MGVGADTWISVEDFGRKRICQIQPGDRVLDQTGKFKPVAQVIDEGMRSAFEVFTQQERRLIVTPDQCVVIREKFSSEEDARNWTWHPLQAIEERGPFCRGHVQLVRAPGKKIGINETVDEQLWLAASVIACGEPLSDGGWLLYAYDKEGPAYQEFWDVAGKLGVRRERMVGSPFDGLIILHEVPFLDDRPVEGSNLPRIFFTAGFSDIEWMMRVLLSRHGHGWPYHAGHYLRAASYISASHLQHVLLRAGLCTGIDCGHRWMVGEGPVWRLQIRNPAEHRASRSQRVSLNDAHDRIGAQRISREHHCFSLVLQGRGPSSFVANDIPVASTAVAATRAAEITEDPSDALAMSA